jgi:hypothetical protein
MIPGCVDRALDVVGIAGLDRSRERSQGVGDRL